MTALWQARLSPGWLLVNPTVTGFHKVQNRPVMHTRMRLLCQNVAFCLILESLKLLLWVLPGGWDWCWFLGGRHDSPGSEIQGVMLRSLPWPAHVLGVLFFACIWGKGKGGHLFVKLPNIHSAWEQRLAGLTDYFFIVGCQWDSTSPPTPNGRCIFTLDSLELGEGDMGNSLPFAFLCATFLRVIARWGTMVSHLILIALFKVTRHVYSCLHWCLCKEVVNAL